MCLKVKTLKYSGKIVVLLMSDFKKTQVSTAVLDTLTTLVFRQKHAPLQCTKVSDGQVSIGFVRIIYCGL